MQLFNEFDVALPPEQTWTLLTDLEKVAPCLPGASITSVDGGEYHGRAKIRVGPITAQYKGTAQFAELDAAAKRAVLRARGKDSRGQGDVTATVTATLTRQGSGTRVTVETDMALTGKVAQFGRGVLADVSGALMGLFAERLEDMITAEGIAPTSDSEPASESVPAETVPPSEAAPTPEPAAVSRTQGPSRPAGTRRAPARDDDEVLDVLALAGGMSWSRLLPAGGALISVLAALISVFAAGYATARARSGGRGA